MKKEPKIVSHLFKHAEIIKDAIEKALQQSLESIIQKYGKSIPAATEVKV
ncbi:MAG: hypothetical protein WCA08_21610 [Desulfoferrobacter sp.]